MFRISWKTHDDKLCQGAIMTFNTAKQWIDYLNNKHPDIPHWIVAV